MHTDLSNEAKLILGNLGSQTKGFEYLDGYAYEYKFPNGFGASIIKRLGSYGQEYDEWEIAVLNKDGDVCYTTPITNDIIGFLSEEDVLHYARKIAALSPDAYYNWDDDESLDEELADRVRELIGNIENELREMKKYLRLKYGDRE